MYKNVGFTDCKGTVRWIGRFTEEEIVRFNLKNRRLDHDDSVLFVVRGTMA